MSASASDVASLEVTTPSPAVPVERTRRFGPRTDAILTITDVDLTGKTMLITGTNAGIGTETARALALKGAHIVMANRNIVQSEELKKSILEEKPDAKIDLILCDLSSLQSVFSAAKEFKEKHWPLHALILNAGVFAPQQKTTIDGFETCFGVNHVAHFLLIRELLPVLRVTDHARIVIVASTSHNHTGVKPEWSVEEKIEKLCPKDANEMQYKLYAYSKMCNILTAMKLHRDERQNGISVYVLHPGTMIGTSIGRSYGFMGRMFNALTKPFTKTLSQGAATTVYCAASQEIAEISGKYWESCWDDEKSLQKELAHDEQLQDALWLKTAELIDQFESKRQPISTLTN